MKKSRSKAAFIQAFLELSKEKASSRLNVSDIVARADYSRGAFYAQWNSLSDFIYEIVDDEAKQYRSVIETAVRTFPEGVCTVPPPSFVALFEYVYSKKELYRFLFSNNIYFNIFDYFCEITMPFSPKYELVFEYPDNVDSSLQMDPVFHMFLSSYVQKACIKYWIASNFRWSPQHMAEQCSLFYHSNTISRKVLE